MPYKPEGDAKKARYVFVAEAPARNEIIDGKPLTGPSGRLHDECLQMAGIPRRSCYTTNVFNNLVKKSKRGQTEEIRNGDGDLLWRTPRDHQSGFTETGRGHVERLGEEISGTSANVVVAMGGVSLNALCERSGIGKLRGSIWPCTIVEGLKVIGTFHTAHALHGNYLARYFITRDYRRAKEQSKYPEIRRPNYQMTLFPSYVEAMRYLDYILKDRCDVSVDIEVANRHISRICFCTSHERTMSVDPSAFFLEEEAKFWLKVAKVLESTEITKIFQNGLFDMTFIAMELGIVTQPPIDDTMVQHHIIFPDFKKNLALLTSLHTDQEYYKDMVHVKGSDIDKADG